MNVVADETQQITTDFTLGHVIKQSQTVSNVVASSGNDQYIIISGMVLLAMPCKTDQKPYNTVSIYLPFLKTTYKQEH